MTEAGMSEKGVMKRKAAMKERKSGSKVSLCYHSWHLLML